MVTGDDDNEGDIPICGRESAKWKSIVISFLNAKSNIHFGRIALKFNLNNSCKKHEMTTNTIILK